MKSNAQVQSRAQCMISMVLALALSAVVGCGEEKPECPPEGCIEDPGTPPDGGSPEDPPDAGTGPRVYVSWSLSNDSAEPRFCHLTSGSPTNPGASGTYIWETLAPGAKRGAYHAHWGPSPYRVEFKVGCWPPSLPESQRTYTTHVNDQNTSLDYAFSYTDATGVVLTGMSVTQ